MKTCALEFIDDRISSALELAELAQRGSWPQSGGTLDQTLWFQSLCLFAWAERRSHMSRLGLRED